MQRFNAFLLIHKGLRAFMYDVSTSIQHTDFAHSTDFPHALERLELLLETFDNHARHEDTFIFCMLNSCNPHLQEEMEKEHVTDHALSGKLRSLIAQYKQATDTAEKTVLGNSIAYTYNDFIAFNLTHLNKEEIVVNESLWQHYSDSEIMAANMRLVGSLTPHEMQASATWMMRGCNNAEIAAWMGSVKKQAPEPAFNMLMGIAERELPQHRFEAIHGAIMEMA